MRRLSLQLAISFPICGCSSNTSFPNSPAPVVASHKCCSYEFHSVLEPITVSSTERKHPCSSTGPTIASDVHNALVTIAAISHIPLHNLFVYDSFANYLNPSILIIVLLSSQTSSHPSPSLVFTMTFDALLHLNPSSRSPNWKTSNFCAVIKHPPIPILM